jgi:hypothetical protein
MNAAVDDGTFQRARTIIADSRTAAFGDWIWRRWQVITGRSRVLDLVRRRRRAFQHLPIGEQARKGLLTAATAVAAHVVLASNLPARARPAVMLTALLLVAVFLAAGAGGSRSSGGSRD